jgi:SIR2-like domain
MNADSPSGRFEDRLADLRALIEKRKVVAIVGSGVSIGASGSSCAGWDGLLRHGIEFAVSFCQADDGWRQRKLAALDGGIDEWVNMAGEVERRLREADEFDRWLRDTVGRLELRNREVIDALHALSIPIATTNYDDLLTRATTLPPILVTKHKSALRWVRGEDEGVLHLHGHWDHADSVVLGITSYQTHLGNEGVQFLQEVFAAVNSVLFIGCGDGLEDPNFSRLRAWMRSVLRGEHRHYRLCLDSEFDEIEAGRSGGEHLYPIAYGPTHEHLASFLRRLAQRPQRDDPETARFMAEIKRRVVVALERAPRLTEHLATTLELSPSATGVGTRASQVAEKLLGAPAGDSFGAVKAAWEALMDQAPEGEGLDKAVGGVIRALVHVIYDDAQIVKLRGSSSGGGVLIAVPAASLTFAELCFARLHGYFPRFEKPAEKDIEREWPFTANRLELEVETGAGFDRLEAAFDDLVIDRFADAFDRATWRNTACSPDEKQDIIERVRDKLRMRDQYKKVSDRRGPLYFIPAKLDPLLHKTDQRHFDEMIKRLMNRWKEISFLKLTTDRQQRQKEADLLWAIRHFLWEAD